MVGPWTDLFEYLVLSKKNLHSLHKNTRNNKKLPIKNQRGKIHGLVTDAEMVGGQITFNLTSRLL